MWKRKDRNASNADAVLEDEWRTSEPWRWMYEEWTNERTDGWMDVEAQI